MAKLVIGGVLGGIAMWFVGFIFWGTPLSLIAFSTTDPATTAAVQSALAQQLGPLGSGAYPIPWPGTAEGTVLYGRGPTAMVMFNTAGFATPDSSSLIAGLLLGIVCSLLVAITVRAVGDGSLRFSQRLTLIALIAVAVTAYADLGEPIFNHAPWRYYVYLWVSDVCSWLAAGAVIVWMVPRKAAAPVA